MYGYGGVDIGCVAVVDVRYLPRKKARDWVSPIWSLERGVAGMERVARFRYPEFRRMVLRLEVVAT